MAWVTIANPSSLKRSKTRRINVNQYGGSLSGSYDSVNLLHQVYRGRQDRIQRYTLWDWMDQDSDVARALDLVAEHCVPNDPQTGLPFQIKFTIDEVTEEIAAILRNHLQYWVKMNHFDVRAFRHVRSVIKYGDWFYWRNPRTFELYSLHPRMVHGAIVDTNKLEILAWIIKGMKFNTEDLELINKSPSYEALQSVLAQASTNQDTKVVPANHIIHLTLNEGKLQGASADDEPANAYFSRWPFGESVLEAMYKTFKQRELLEDAFLIHRIQRAPTRRVWYIDIGKNRPDRAKWIINDFRNELTQRRIPQFIGSDAKTVDSTYNPQAQLEDYYIPVSQDSRGSKVENLEGQPWNDIPELKYMTTKMYRALRVPFSMLLGSGSSGEETGSVFSDSKTGTAYQPEIQFSKWCTRLQGYIWDEFDFEFKLFVIEASNQPITAADFELHFNDPTNYEEYLQNLRDQDNIAIWAQIKDETWISRRFAAKKYLRWTAQDFVENEKQFVEENFPLNEIPAEMAGGGAGGAGLGALPPPPNAESELTPQDMEASGNNLGNPPLAGGSTAGAGASGATTAAGTPVMASRSMRMDNKSILFEDEINLSDIKPVKKKLSDVGTYTDRTADDQTFMADDPVQGAPKVTLRMLRDLRRAHSRRRAEYQKRLRIIAKMYKKTGAEGEAGGGGMGPPI